ncbi:hypothetical protein HPHPM4_1530 [Helicobacter pylori Hp M4]|nr:hypothetical protein HPHPM4_1530 [Helicobacter pylori Hp M4]
MGFLLGWFKKGLKNSLIHIDLAFIWDKTILNEKDKKQIEKNY